MNRHRLNYILKRYSNTTIYLKLLVSIIIFLLLHFSVNILLQLALLIYTSGNSIPFPSVGEFDSSIFKPFFYIKLILNYIITILLFICGFIVSLSVKDVNIIKTNKLINKIIGHYLGIYRFVVKFLKRNSNDLLVKCSNDVKIFYRLFIIIIIILLVVISFFLVGQNLIYLMMVITPIFTGYMVAINYDEFGRIYVTISLIFLLFLTMPVALVPDEFDQYLKFTGVGGDVKISVILKNDNKLDGYLILRTTKNSFLFDSERINIICIDNSEIKLYKINYIDSKFYFSFFDFVRDYFRKFLFI